MNLNKHFKRNKNSIKFNFKIIVIGENQEDNLVPKLIGEKKITDNTDNYTWNGYINQAVWEEMGNGSVIIKFYANDSAGNIGFDEVTIRKDVTAPTITINLPTLNELFGTSAPSFNVEIGDTSLDTMWYSLYNGLTNTTFITNGTINQALWEVLPEGNVFKKKKTHTLLIESVGYGAEYNFPIFFNLYQ